MQPLVQATLVKPSIGPRSGTVYFSEGDIVRGYTDEDGHLDILEVIKGTGRIPEGRYARMTLQVDKECFDKLEVVNADQRKE